MFSLGILLFMFVAKFVVMALIAAAVMSLVFFAARRMRYFFSNLSWEERPYYYDHVHYRQRRGLNSWQFEPDYFAESLERPTELVSNYRVIKVQ